MSSVNGITTVNNGNVAVSFRLFARLLLSVPSFFLLDVSSAVLRRRSSFVVRRSSFVVRRSSIVGLSSSSSSSSSSCRWLASSRCHVGVLHSLSLPLSFSRCVCVCVCVRACCKGTLRCTANDNDSRKAERKRRGSFSFCSDFVVDIAVIDGR